MMGITELEEIRLVLVGNTGSGKSSSGNTILGQKEFLAKLSASSVTKKCQAGSIDRAFDDDQMRMRKITVVDMPGFGDTHLSEKEIHTEIASCLYHIAPGPHAFLLVVPIGRYTDYEAQAVNHLAKIFGDDAVKYHTIVLFTKGDDLQGSEFDEYLKESPEGLRELIDKCGGRYHVFNNKENYGNATQVQELMLKVDKMVKESQTEFYTNAMFKAAEAIREAQKTNRIVAAGTVGLAVGVAFGVAVPLTAAFSAHLAGSAVGLAAAKLTGASAAGAVSAVVAAAKGSTALAIGATAGGLVGGGMGIIAGSEAESVKEGVSDTLVQVGSVGVVALAASVVVGASLGTGVALSAGTGAGAANIGLAPLAAQNRPTSAGTLAAGTGTTSYAATGAHVVQDTVQVAPAAAAAGNTVADAVVAIAKVAGAFLPATVVVKVVVDKTKDSQKSTYEVSCKTLPSQSAEQHEPVDMMGITELEEIRLVLVGNTGSGKSSSGNTILGQKKFLAKASASSVTKKCQSVSIDHAFDDDQKRMRKITVVDMPGFGDTHLSEEEIYTEMAKCLDHTTPGLHAFLLVVPIGRKMDHEAQAVKHLANIFGDDAVKYHTIVLFTKGDDVKGLEFDEFLKESPDGLREVIDKCGGRYHVFNNKENYGNATQVQELMLKVDKMVKESKTELYTNAMFKAAEAIREAQKRKRIAVAAAVGLGLGVALGVTVPFTVGVGAVGIAVGAAAGGFVGGGIGGFAGYKAKSVNEGVLNTLVQVGSVVDVALAVASAAGHIVADAMRGILKVGKALLHLIRRHKKTPLKRCNTNYYRIALPSRSAERHEPVDMMGIAELEEIRLVLVGNTGSGKSSSGNTVFGEVEFEAKLSASSVTRKCQSGSIDRAFDDDQKRMRKITVVDMPGFGDTHLSEEEIYTEMAKCLYYTSPGLHAFLLVVPIGRYTDHEAQAVNHLANIFGDDAVKYHTIVLFTKGDDLQGLEFDEYLKESPDCLRELIDKCGGRYHVFNNKENYGNATQVQELMLKVDKMVKESKTEFYTNAMFKEAEAAIREEQKRNQEMELETNNEESQPAPQSIRKLRQDQKPEGKLTRALRKILRKVAPSPKLMVILKRIVAAGAVGLAVGVAFGVAVPLIAGFSACVVGGAVGLAAAELTGACAAGAVSGIVAAASGNTALAIGAAAGGLVGGGMGIIAGYEAESVKEGVVDTLVQVGRVGGVALAASAGLGASLGTGAALSAGTGAAAAGNTVADAVVGITKVAGVLSPAVKAVVDKTKDSKKSCTQYKKRR
ncbi:uncharacterized protein LOC133170736 [Syngnathus typhle]|uniref:uncharacterized protein LOC133170736 n=1 Tax=Syngnathus typhle TaxID=161592 RepID=UPI002A69F12F|nr:uncharacterized protein LOC133170736 [Syngnathus typhle]